MSCNDLLMADRLMAKKWEAKGGDMAREVQPRKPFTHSITHSPHIALAAKASLATRPAL